MKNFFYVLGSIVAILIISFIIQGSDWFMYKIFAPQYEQVRREVFEESQAYNQGMVEELQNMRFEYERTDDPKSKQAMASIIIHRASQYPREKLPEDLRIFINQLEREVGNYEN